jgi:hypothetical protein
MEGVNHGRSLLHAGLGDVYLLLSGLGVGWPMSLASPEAGKNENIPPDVDAGRLRQPFSERTLWNKLFCVFFAAVRQIRPSLARTPPTPRTSSLEVVYMRQHYT